MRRLILRPGAIGDCILALPAIEHLLKQSRTTLGNPACALGADHTEVWISSPVVPLIPFADRVCALSSTGIDRVGLEGIEFDPILRKRLQTFDSIVSWYGTKRPEFRKAISELGVECKFLDPLPPDSFREHAGTFFARQVGADETLLPRIVTHGGGQRGRIVIHPFSGSKPKNWPLDQFRELARRLEGFGVEWTAGPEESLEGAHRFERLDQLAEWLSGAKLFIGNDSGITHLAASTGTPTLALFGPTEPAKWAPRGEHVRVLHATELERLSVQRVIGEVAGLLG